MAEGTCDVSIGGYDGDPAEVWSVKRVTARKAHVCAECREMIQPTQQYERAVGLFDGEWSTWRICLSCCEISVEFTEGGGRVYGGEMWQELEDNWAGGAHLQACLNRLTTVSAKELMRRRWLKWKQIEAVEVR